MVHTARDICPTKVLKMAIRAAHDALMKHRGLTLKQSPVESMARYTFAIVDAEHGRMTGAASAIQRGMRLRQGPWIDHLFPKADDIVVPKLSILAEPPVTVVDGNADAKGTRKVADASIDRSGFVRDFHAAAQWFPKLARLEPDRIVRRYVIGVAMAITVAVGFSRIYLGVHWPSDVIGGWCLGALWVIAVSRTLDAAIRRVNGA